MNGPWYTQQLPIPFFDLGNCLLFKLGARRKLGRGAEQDTLHFTFPRMISFLCGTLRVQMKRLPHLSLPCLLPLSCVSSHLPLLAHVSISPALCLTCESQLCRGCPAICPADGASSSFIFCFLGLNDCLSISGKCFISIAQVCARSGIYQRGNRSVRWSGNVGAGWDVVYWGKKQDSWAWNIRVKKVLTHPSGSLSPPS